MYWACITILSLNLNKCFVFEIKCTSRAASSKISNKYKNVTLSTRMSDDPPPDPSADPSVTSSLGSGSGSGAIVTAAGSYSSLCKSIEIAMIILWEDFT